MIVDVAGWEFQGRAAYTLFMLLAMLGFLATRYFQPKSVRLHGRLLPWQRWTLLMSAFVGGSFGSKIPFWLTPLAQQSGFQWLGDGKTVTAALAGAYLAVELSKSVLGIRIKTGDSFALPLAVALAIGRWGCFFNPCCFGAETLLPWGVDFIGDGARHPTQIYEVLFHASMGLVLWLLIKRDHLQNHRLQFYLITYCLFRFLTEWIRPEPALGLGLTFYQWFSAIFALALAVQWIVELRWTQAPPETSHPQTFQESIPGKTTPENFAND